MIDPPKPNAMDDGAELAKLAQVRDEYIDFSDIPEMTDAQYAAQRSSWVRGQMMKEAPELIAARNADQRVLNHARMTSIADRRHDDTCPTKPSVGQGYPFTELSMGFAVLHKDRQSISHMDDIHRYYSGYAPPLDYHQDPKQAKPSLWERLKRRFR